jgi:hypothetical protein
MKMDQITAFVGKLNFVIYHIDKLFWQAEIIATVIY